MSDQEKPVDNRGIRFSIDPHEINLDQLLRLFDTNAFWAQERHRDRMELAIRCSDALVSIWDQQKLVGFGRATSDRVYRAVLWDIVVDGEYRQQGIGRKLVETLISHPELQHVERVYLFTTHQRGFYERIGFVENPSTTLVLMNKPVEFITPAASTSQA